MALAHREPKRTPATRWPFAIALLAGLAVLLATSWLLLFTPAREPARPRDSAAPGPATPAVDAGPAAPSPDPRPSRRDAAADAFVVDESYPLDDLPPAHARLRVVHAADGSPAAFATVWFWPPTYLPHELREPRDGHQEGLFRYLQAMGAAGRADAAGRVLVPLANDTLAIAAQLATATGTMEYDARNPPPPGGWILPIAPSPSLRIEVRDHTGMPVAHAPLGYRVALEWGPSEPRELGFTDAEGNRVVDAAADVLPAARTRQVSVLWPGCAAASTEFDERASTVRITLAPAGRIEVQFADRDGNAIPGHHRVEVAVVEDTTAEPDPWRRADWSDRTEADGCLRLPGVAVGKTFEVDIEDQRLRCRGPTRPGEVVRAVVHTDTDEIVFRGRLLATDGTPIRSSGVLGRLQRDDPDRDSKATMDRLWPTARTKEGRELAAPGHGSPPAPRELPTLPPSFCNLACRTDDRGHFQFVASMPAPDSWRGLLWLLPAPRSPDCRHVEFVVPAAKGGDTVDLGDLVVDDEGLVMSGRITTEDGRPVTHATCNADWWFSPGAPRTVTLVADDGSFRVYRSRSAPELPVQFTVQAHGCRSAGHTGNEGDHGVRIVLRRAAQLRVEALVDAAVLPLAPQAQLSRLGDRFQGGPAHVATDRWAWQFEGPFDEAEFAIELQHQEGLFAHTRLACDAGRTHVHRLDLRGQLQVHEVELRDANGEALDGHCRTVDRAEDGQTWHHASFETTDGLARILTRQPAIELLVTAHEHEAVHVVAGKERIRVVLRRMPQLQLRLRCDAGDLELQLQAVAPDGRAEPVNGPFLPAAFGPLPLQVALRIENEVVFVLPLTPLVIEPAMEQNVDIELAPDQLAQLRAARPRR